MDNKKLITTALASVVALGLVGGATADSHKPVEKCYGVVKAGKNDCGNKNHACGGNAKKDGAGDEWLYLPQGTCSKLVNGSIEPFDNSQDADSDDADDDADDGDDDE